MIPQTDQPLNITYSSLCSHHRRKSGENPAQHTPEKVFTRLAPAYHTNSPVVRHIQLFQRPA
jgi:hypothetical protein